MSRANNLLEQAIAIMHVRRVGSFGGYCESESVIFLAKMSVKLVVLTILIAMFSIFLWAKKLPHFTKTVYQE